MRSRTGIVTIICVGVAGAAAMLTRYAVADVDGDGWAGECVKRGSGCARV